MQSPEGAQDVFRLSCRKLTAWWRAGSDVYSAWRWCDVRTYKLVSALRAVLRPQGSALQPAAFEKAGKTFSFFTITR